MERVPKILQFNDNIRPCAPFDARLNGVAVASPTALIEKDEETSNNEIIERGEKPKKQTHQITFMHVQLKNINIRTIRITGSGNMEASPYEGILKSPTFKFVVGEAKEELFLHSTLVASKSEVLGKMIKGPFIEGQLGYATLADEDVRTIAAFAEFIYTGDYQIKKDTSQSDGGSGTPIHFSRLGSHDDDLYRIHKQKQILIRPTNVHWQKFTQGTEYGSLGCATTLSGSIDTDYSDYFIAHAKIFSKAELICDDYCKMRK
ncbi:hypothetical protein E4U33_005123 [Claviceps sp. LM78 group G4]|nr:hypothetical protein E4U33_005123 [Claviceps sp. LM78 group G4]